MGVVIDPADRDLIKTLSKPDAKNLDLTQPGDLFRKGYQVGQATANAMAKVDLYYGEVSIGHPATATIVTFTDVNGKPFLRADNKYFVICNVEGAGINTDFAYASSKQQTSFQINCEPGPGAGNTAKVQYLVIGSGA